MKTEPNQETIGKILTSARFGRLYGAARADHPAESAGGAARWAFIQYQGWPVSFENRFNGSGLNTEQRNGLNYVYGQFNSDYEQSEILSPFGVGDYVKTFGNEFETNLLEVLPSGAAFVWFAKNAKWVIPTVAALYFTPAIIKTAKTLNSKTA